MDLTEAIKTLIAHGRELAGAQYVEDGNVPYVIDGSGDPKAMPELLFNEYNARPVRIKADVRVHDARSFGHYWSTFANPDSICFANETDMRVVGILDYHDTDARWCQHRVTLAMQQSEEWKTWIAANNKQLTQQQFAEFLEQYSMDIVAPAPGAMMEIARDLVTTTECEFSQGVRMQDGQVRFKWTETVNAKVGGGQLAVPEHFTIAIPIFVGAPKTEIPALFRFRVKEGHLTMWYTLVRPDAARRAAFGDAVNAIASNLNIAVLNGSPA